MECNGESQFLVEVLESWEVADVYLAKVSMNALVAPSFTFLHCFFDQHRAQAPVLNVTFDPDIIKESHGLLLNMRVVSRYVNRACPTFLVGYRESRES